MAVASKVLMALTVPLSCTLEVPLVLRVTPAVVAALASTVTVPCPTLRVTLMLPVPASTSAMLKPVITNAVSSAVVCAVGTVLTGASLTALMLMATVSEALENALLPPLVAVLTLLPTVPLVLSHATKVTASAVLPLVLAAGL